MKKILLFAYVCTLIVTFSGSSLAQKFSVGEYYGINFSNLHGKLISDKWESKPGTSAGIVFEYDLFRTLALQSEVSYLKLYYERKSYQPDYPIVLPWEAYLSSGYIYYPYTQSANWDFSFLRIPLILKYKTPTRLQFELGGGAYYAFLMNDEFTKAEREKAKENNQTLYPPTFDWGYLFTSGLSYPLTDQVRLFLSARYTTGRKVFIEDYKAKNGSGELLFGFKYEPFFNRRRIREIPSFPDRDSLESRVYIKPLAGMIRSWNSAKKQSGNYSANNGISTGVILGYHLNRTVSLQSGVLFERKGYTMQDSSIYFHRYATANTNPEYWVDSDIALDYLSVPVKINLAFGEPFTVYANMGIYSAFMVNALCRGTAITQSNSPTYFEISKTNINNSMDGLFKSVDYGLTAGMGFQFPVLKTLKLDAGISYSQGFTNVLKAPEYPDDHLIRNDLSVRNRQVSIQVGLQVPISY